MEPKWREYGEIWKTETSRQTGLACFSSYRKAVLVLGNGHNGSLHSQNLHTCILIATKYTHSSYCSYFYLLTLLFCDSFKNRVLKVLIVCSKFCTRLFIERKSMGNGSIWLLVIKIKYLTSDSAYYRLLSYKQSFFILLYNETRMTFCLFVQFKKKQIWHISFVCIAVNFRLSFHSVVMQQRSSYLFLLNKMNYKRMGW